MRAGNWSADEQGNVGFSPVVESASSAPRAPFALPFVIQGDTASVAGVTFAFTSSN